MGQAQAQDTLQPPAAVGSGWLAFQLLGFLTAVSWLVSYAVFLDGYTALQTVFGLTNPVWILGGIGYFLSPLLSVVLIVIAVWPTALAGLTRETRTAVAVRASLFLVPFLWLGSVFAGDPSMINTMLASPLGHSSALPVTGGAFVHTVFQHWFQGFAAMLLALMPGRFATLTDADQPPGTSAVVHDVTAQMDLERRLAALHDATRDMMTADRSAEVATIAAEASRDVLDIPYSRVHLRDEASGELVPTAWTDETEQALDGEPPTVDPDSGTVWETFQTGDASYYHQYDGLDERDAPATPLESSLLLPLGDEGIMLIQSTEPAAFTDAKLEMAHILSATTEAALARTARERDMELLRALLDHSSNSVFVLTPETGRINDVNEPACRQLGYTRADLLSRSIHDLMPDEAAVDASLQTAREEGRDTLVTTAHGMDGATAPIHLTLSHVTIDQEYILGIATDVSEQTARQDELTAQRTELEVLGFIQTLVDDIVHQVLAATPRTDIEQRTCEGLRAAPFYADAWLVAPTQDEQLAAPQDGTPSGGTLTAVTELPADRPSTETIQDTIATPATHVLEGNPAAPTATDATDDIAATDETAIALPLTAGTATYGALVVVSDRPAAFGEREQAALETLAVALALAIHVRTQAHTPQDAAVELELHATDAPSVMTTLAARLACPVQLEGLVPRSDGTVSHYYVAETDLSAAALRDRVAGTTNVEDCRLLDQDGDCVFEVRSQNGDILDRLVEAGGVIRSAEATPDAARLVIDLLPDADPEAIQAVVQAAGGDWAVTEERPVERPLRQVHAACQTLEDTLTAKQREALLTAYFAGYYDHPRSSTAQEVAEMLAITDSTLFQHLQAAQRKLIEAWTQPPTQES